MTDQELLEAAAKAAGLNVRDWTPTIFAGEEGLRDWPHEWNPLTDDGDALRLAVKLKASIHLRPHRVEILGWPEAPAPLGYMGSPIPKVLALEAYAEDPYAATRRAIVRAAAEAGRTKT